MFIHTDIFVNAIVVLLHRQTEVVRKIITDFLTVCDTELRTGIQMNDEHIRFYINFLKNLLDSGSTISDRSELEALTLKIHSNGVAVQNKEIRDTLIRIINSPEHVSDERINQILEDLKANILWFQINKGGKKIWSASASFTNTINRVEQHIAIDKMRSAIMDLHEIIQLPAYNNTDDTVVNKVDFSCKDSIRQALTQYQKTNVQNIMKFGLQGMNRMFGKPGGFNLTESIVFLALSHHYKSRMLMNIARWIAQYNNPVNITGGIPTILFISLENEANSNLMTLFKDTYVAFMKVEPENVSDDEIIEFVFEHFNSRGWKLIVERRLGDNFGFAELRQLVEGYEKLGHKICVTIIDYMNLMKKSGSDSNGNHLLLAALYENVTNYLKHKGCALITAHQLNRDASKIASNGLTNVVSKLNMDHLADGVGVFRSIDVACFLYIEKSQFGIPYLTMRIAKHRYVDDTPEGHKTCAYRFTKYGIIDDIHDVDQSVRDIYSDKYVAPDTITTTNIAEGVDMPPMVPTEVTVTENVGLF